jgi:hypothetical protein
MPKPDDWPDELEVPVMYTVDLDLAIPFVPFGDGRRVTSERQTIKVDFRDSDDHLELDVVIVDGRPCLVEVRVSGNDLPLSTLRHHKLAEHMEQGLRMTTTPLPTADNMRLTIGPKATPRAEVRKARRLTVTDDVLAQMLAVYREAGEGGDGVRAVQARWPGHYRNRDRQVQEAKRREQERAGR